MVYQGNLVIPSIFAVLPGPLLRGNSDGINQSNLRNLSDYIISNETFVTQDECKLIFNSEVVQIKSVVPKAINKELRSRVITPPTAQLRFNH